MNTGVYSYIKRKDKSLTTKIHLLSSGIGIASAYWLFNNTTRPLLEGFSWYFPKEKYADLLGKVAVQLPNLADVLNRSVNNYKNIFSGNLDLQITLPNLLLSLSFGYILYSLSVIFSTNIMTKTLYPLLQEALQIDPREKVSKLSNELLLRFYKEYDIPASSEEVNTFSVFLNELKESDTGVRQRRLLELILGDRVNSLYQEENILSLFFFPIRIVGYGFFGNLRNLIGILNKRVNNESSKLNNLRIREGILSDYLSLPLTKNKGEKELNRLFIKYDDLNKKMINIYLDLLTQIPREEKDVFYPILRVEKLPYYNIKTFFLPIRQELTKEMIKTLIKHGVLVKTHETPNSIIFTLNKEHSLLKDYKRIHNLAIKVVKSKGLEGKLELEAKTIIKLNQVYFKIGEKGLIPTPIGISELSRKEIEDSVSGVNCEIKDELNKVRGNSLLFFVNEYLEGVPLESYLRMLKETSASVSRKLRDKKSKEELNDLFKRKKEMIIRVFGKVLLTTKRLEKERYDPELQEITTKTRILSYKGFVEDEVMKRLSTYREYSGEDILDFKGALEKVVQELINNTPAKDHKLGLVDATIGNFIMRLKKSRKRKDLIEVRLSILDPEIIRQPFIVNIYQLLFDPRNYLTSQERDVLLLEMLEIAKKHKVITNYENAKLQFSLYELITRLSTGLMFLEFAMNAEEQGNYNTAKGFITKSKMFLSRVNKNREPYFYSQIRDKHQEIADKQMELLINGKKIIKPLLKTLDERLLRLDGYNV